MQFVNGVVIFHTVPGSCPFGNTQAQFCIWGPNDRISYYSPDQPITEVRVYTESLEFDTFTIDNVTSVPEPVAGILMSTALLAGALLKIRTA
ncbi:MAG: hypothetical protein ACRD8O_21405 [Bryobacteraceae bacterium]